LIINRPTLEGIREAALLLEPPFSKTPLFRSEQLSRQLDADIWLKVESINPIASFKSRGATVAISRAISRHGITEIVTSSTGNHGQGVALAAGLRHVTSHVFMPSNPNPVKLAMIESLGAIVHKIGTDLDYAKAEAIAFAAERGSYFVDDGEDIDVMEGAGTVGLEIAEALDSIDRVFFPMGSGNLVAGCATALKAIHPAMHVTAVQSAESPAMAESFTQRNAVELPAASVADGLECRVPAELALERVIALVDDVITIPDDGILRACRTMLDIQHLVTEPAGAAALAGAASVAKELRAKRVVLVVSGANLTPALFIRAMEGPGLF
jgi:threonine dehydratase